MVTALHIRQGANPMPQQQTGQELPFCMSEAWTIHVAPSCASFTRCQENHGVRPSGRSEFFRLSEQIPLRILRNTRPPPWSLYSHGQPTFDRTTSLLHCILPIMSTTFEPRPESDLIASLNVAIQASACGRHLVRHVAPEEPFFYLGDTAWELFHRLDDKEAEMYLRNRQAKGFNSVMVVVLAEHG